MKKCLAIDGNSLLYRAYFASINYLEYSKKNNLPIANAFKFMLDMVFRIIKQTKYDYGIIAFDASKKTHRSELYENYKLGRKPMPEDLILQIDDIKTALTYMGFKILEYPGVEADDFLGSFAKNMSKLNHTVHIYSSDKDLLQLVDENISVYLIKTGLSNVIINNITNFFELNKIYPWQIVDYKALVGDSSDNLPGIKGIGPSIAINLLNSYSSFDNIYKNIDQLSSSIKNKLLSDRENGLISKSLAKIDLNVINSFNPEDFLLKNFKINQLLALFKKLNVSGLDKYLKISNEKKQIGMFE